MSITFSVGKWGGIYKANSPFSFRLCLGFVSVTVFKKDIDDVLEEYIVYKQIPTEASSSDHQMFLGE